MKKIIHSLVLASVFGGLTLLFTAAALAQGNHFYVKGGIGPSLTEDTSLKEFNGPVSGVKVQFDPIPDRGRLSNQRLARY
jgi:hypothetical protein